MNYQRFLRYLDEVARAGSIRKAAERLNVTASAVNRRIMDLEEELGSPLFERRARGVRLTAAGELFVRYIREQLSEVDRMKSQIEDLKGLRRGTVRIACSQALAHEFLPRQIAQFRLKFPLVDFDVRVHDHEQAMRELAAFEVDLVLVFRPPYLANFRPLMSLQQRLVALMSEQHPLAARKTIRLRDCVGYPVALPEPSIGGRQLLDQVLARGNLRLNVVAQSNSFEFLRNLAMHGDVISFQIKIGTGGSDASHVVARDIDDRDVPHGDLVFGQLRGRNLPVAASKFSEGIVAALQAMRSEAAAV